MTSLSSIMIVSRLKSNNRSTSTKMAIKPGSIFFGIKNAIIIYLIRRSPAVTSFIHRTIGLHTLISRLDRSAGMYVIPYKYGITAMEQIPHIFTKGWLLMMKTNTNHGPEAGDRRLIYIPILHTDADMGRLSGPVRLAALKKLGISGIKKQNGFNQ